MCIRDFYVVRHLGPLTNGSHKTCNRCLEFFPVRLRVRHFDFPLSLMHNYVFIQPGSAAYPSASALLMLWPIACPIKTLPQNVCHIGRKVILGGWRDNMPRDVADPARYPATRGCVAITTHPRPPALKCMSLKHLAVPSLCAARLVIKPVTAEYRTERYPATPSIGQAHRATGSGPAARLQDLVARVLIF